jgi:hypothetical protein
MMNSPAYSFIKERIELEFQRLEKDKITPWAFFLTDKGLRLTNFFGKPEKIPRGRSSQHSQIHLQQVRIVI